MKVGNWMNRAVPDVPPTMRLGEVLFTLLRYDLNGVPVLDENKKLVGIVTESDIMRRVFPKQGELGTHPEYAQRPETIEDRFVEVADLPVSEVMSTQVLSISPDKTLVQAAALMEARHVRQLPVVDAHGQVLGLITPAAVAWGFLVQYRRRT